MIRQFLLLLCSLILSSHGASIPAIESESTSGHLRFFYFPSADNRSELFLNDVKSLDASGLKPGKKTYVIFDGFTSTVDSYMITETKNAFATVPDVNVIAADWRYYNGKGLVPEKVEGIKDVILAIYAYIRALLSVPTTGNELANFLEFLRANKQIEFENVVILSHSLGCHAAGATGKAVQRLFNTKIGRIVGLDPAYQFAAIEAPIRLGTGDASVVEMYHTGRDLKGIGDDHPGAGDVMVFPNGGEKQPCAEQGVPGTEECNSHSYSWKLYNYALFNTTMRACPCHGAACFCNDCDNECSDDDAIIIGPSIREDARGSFHLKTGFVQWD